MRRLVGASLLTLALLAACAVELHAQKDKKKDQPAVDSAKLHGEFIGTLKTTPGTDRVFIVSVETKKLVLPKNYNPRNGNANTNRVTNLQNQINNSIRQAQNARSPQQRYQAMQRVQNQSVQLQNAIVQLIANANKNGGLPPGARIDTVKQDVEFQASETIKVRTMLLPEAFDDKGNPKKYTKEEKDELKGKDKNAVGYESSLEKLETGMKVRVALTPAPKKKEDAEKKKEDADKDKDDLKDHDADKKMQVKLLVILEESQGSTAPNPKKKKNK
jgi:hypothetical protein